MELRDERRRDRRIPAEGAVYLAGERNGAPFEARGRLCNVSARGMAFRLKDKLPCGTILWCAAPALALYERAEVCHSSGSLFRRGVTGLRFLAPPFHREPE